MKKAAFHNLGCKVNSYELDIMRQILLEEGYEEVPFHEQADVYVINTCTVTNIADRKSRQMLHRAKKQNREAVVIAAGCYVETDPERVEKDDAIDLVIGNNRKSEIGTILRDYLENREKLKNREEQKEKEEPEEKAEKREKARPDKRFFKEDLTCSPVYEDMQLEVPGHTRAFIKIQDGCNQFCSYCIIPFARGRIRSRDKGEILREAERLAAGGIREIVLTGIHVSSYGLDREAEGPVRFDPDKAGAALLDLLQDLSSIRGLERIRLSSLEPRIMTESFISRLASLRRVCPHFHLSLQSGCDETLRRMNRHYTAAEYAQSVCLLRQYYDRPALTTDVIVGFPGETEEEFDTTCAFLENTGFYEIHVFRYSRRNGTVAAKRKDQIPEPVKAVRSDRLLEMTAAQAAAYRAQFAGERETLLLEEICEHDGVQYWTGNTTRYVTGAFPVSAPEGTGTLQAGDLVSGVFGTLEIPFSRGAALFFIPDDVPASTGCPKWHQQISPGQP